MTQGLFVNGTRPKSKKAVKEAVAADPATVDVEATSVFSGTEYGGPLDKWPGGETLFFVGPDPYTSRKFYGQISRKADGSLRVS